ncbi:AraC family transcriptional regulator [Vibrio sp. HN007]|uniref:AraC family transcriptional regulator n=1 Tax=Vibrio iocasae TaxID=3098914 RepID=UPI0035D416B1
MLESLPEHHRKRFESALYMMHNSLEESLSWEQIAEKSAISPYHFHRQFTQLFNETPGHYLSRVRLQYAVYLLFIDNGLKITEIAHNCGYSSSQAMAKVLKRELGMTAKDVRQHVETGTPDETSQLLEKLSHPGKSLSMEKQLASSMPTELVWYPARGMKTVDIPDFDWDLIFDTYKEKSTQLIGATQITELEKPWNEIRYRAGEWQLPEEQFDFYISEGYYLCCEVYLITDTAYAAAIDGLFEQAESQGYQIDESGYLVEMVRDVELREEGGATFALQIPVTL